MTSQPMDAWVPIGHRDMHCSQHPSQESCHLKSHKTRRLCFVLSFWIRRLKGKVVLTRVGEKLRAQLDQPSPKRAYIV